MKVKDLRDYLELREISTEMCREKDELVFLILGQQCVAPQGDRTTWGPPFTVGSTTSQPSFLAVPQTGFPAPASPDDSLAWDLTNPVLQPEDHLQVTPQPRLDQSQKN